MRKNRLSLDLDNTLAAAVGKRSRRLAATRLQVLSLATRVDRH